MNDDEAYFDLRRVRSILENYKNMAYVYKETTETGKESFTVDYDGIPYENSDRTFTMDSFNATTEQVKNDMNFMEEHQDWITAVRSVPGLSNFLLDMENRIGKTDPEGYQNYCNVSRKMAEIFLGLNPDLVGKQNLVGIEDISALQGTELNKKIRQSISEKDFERACEFEDRWYLSECERVAKVIEETKEGLGERQEDRLDFLTETTFPR